jgi:Cof subfamily protein (haloacid dehalogenase superfamily)
LAGHKAFVTDLDGTLLRSDGTLSKYTQHILSTVIEAGHTITFATARGLVSAWHRVNGVPWPAPVIVYNGALVMDPGTGEILWGRFLAADVGGPLLELGERLGSQALVFGIDGEGHERIWHQANPTPGIGQFLVSRAGDPRLKERPRLQLDPNTHPLMLSFIVPEADAHELKAAVQADFGKVVQVHMTPDTYQRSYWFVEVSHPHADKGEALKAWASLMGLDVGNITAFGDNLNDLSLFKTAGHAVAVASGHPDVIRLADDTAPPNDLDGVAQYLAAALCISGD